MVVNPSSKDSHTKFVTLSEVNDLSKRPVLSNKVKPKDSE